MMSGAKPHWIVTLLPTLVFPALTAILLALLPTREGIHSHAEGMLTAAVFFLVIAPLVTLLVVLDVVVAVLLATKRTSRRAEIYGRIVKGIAIVVGVVSTGALVISHLLNPQLAMELMSLAIVTVFVDATYLVAGRLVARCREQGGTASN